MLSPPLLSVFLGLTFVVSTTIAFSSLSNTTAIEVTVLDPSSFEDFLKESGLIPVSRSINDKETLRYTFGARDHLNDKLVDQGSGGRSSSLLQNYQLHFDYPYYGNGALITYVEIDVEQTSKEGKSYILSGGIKERNISIMLEAYGTYSLKFSFKVYGIY